MQDSLEHVILITLHEPGFPPIPCNPVNFLGTREQAFKAADEDGRYHAAKLGASRFTVEVLS